MIRIKICGICDLESARFAVEAGADMIGFHFCNSDRRVSPEDARAILDELVAGTDDWPDPIMLDSWSADQRGGTGRTWDWEVARPLFASRSVFIAGGLEPGNVGKVVSEFRPYGVDVSSGVER